MIKDFVALDLEATGLSSKTDRIIEIGMVRYRDAKETDSYQTFINPGRRLEENIKELTHITDEDVENAPEFKDVCEEIRTFLGEDVLVGHHVITDFALLKKEFLSLKVSFDKEAIDTLRIARAMHPELSSKRLGDMCKEYQIQINAHRALEDARATAQLYLKMAEKFEAKEPKLFEPTQLHYAVKKTRPIRKAQVERIRMLVEMYHIDCPYDIEKMTCNEASRYIDVIRANYGQ